MCSSCGNGETMSDPMAGKCCGECKPSSCTTRTGVTIESGKDYTSPRDPCRILSCNRGKISVTIKDCVKPRECEPGYRPNVTHFEGICCGRTECVKLPDKCASVECNRPGAFISDCCVPQQNTSFCKTDIGVLKSGSVKRDPKDPCRVVECVRGKTRVSVTSAESCPEPQITFCKEGEDLKETKDPRQCCPTYTCEPKDSTTCGTEECGSCPRGQVRATAKKGECCGKCVARDCKSDRGFPIRSGGSYIDPRTPCVNLTCTLGKIVEFEIECASPPKCKDGYILESRKYRGKCCAVHECVKQEIECSTVRCARCEDNEQRVEDPSNKCCGKCEKVSSDCELDSGLVIKNGNKTADPADKCLDVMCKNGETRTHRRPCAQPRIRCPDGHKRTCAGQ